MFFDGDKYSSQIELANLDILRKREIFADIYIYRLFINKKEFLKYPKISDVLDVYKKNSLMWKDGYQNVSWSGFEPTTFKYKDSSNKSSSNRYTYFIFNEDNEGFSDEEYRSVRIWDDNNDLIYSHKLPNGYIMVCLPWGYTIEAYSNIADEPSICRIVKSKVYDSIDSRFDNIYKRQRFVDNCVQQLHISSNEFDNLSSPITDLGDYEKGIPLDDGSIWWEDSWSFDPRIYTYKDSRDLDVWGSNRYTSFVLCTNPSGINNSAAVNALVYDSSMNLIWTAKLDIGYWQISLPWGYTIKIYTHGKEEIVKYFDGILENNTIFNSSSGINPWNNKIGAFYGDSVTEIGQGTGTTNGCAFFPYQSDWGVNWQLYIAKYLNLKGFYSRGIGSARYEYDYWVAYINSTYGQLQNRPYPFVDYDDAEEISGCIKVHGNMASWDRIKAQFPTDIKDTIDFVFCTCSNSAVGHTSKDWDIPTFDTNATKDAAWAADTDYNINGGDYDITTFSGAICSMIMKLQAWMPNTQIIIGSQISGRGDDDISESKSGKNFTKLDEAWRGMICAEKTREICAMMSIPYIPLFESMSVNPLNREGKISDIVHPLAKNGAYKVGKTIAQYLTIFTPSTPEV